LRVLLKEGSPYTKTSAYSKEVLTYLHTVVLILASISKPELKTAPQTKQYKRSVENAVCFLE